MAEYIKTCCLKFTYKQFSNNTECHIFTYISQLSRGKNLHGILGGQRSEFRWLGGEEE